jgi:uncharacterized protein YjiS (DUF1127 family)
VSQSHDNALELARAGFDGDRIAQAAGLPANLLRLARSHLRAWAMRLEERAFLASLGEFELRRLGLTPDQRNDEIGKGFWQR